MLRWFPNPKVIRKHKEGKHATNAKLCTIYNVYQRCAHEINLLLLIWRNWQMVRSVEKKSKNRSATKAGGSWGCITLLSNASYPQLERTNALNCTLSAWLSVCCSNANRRVQPRRSHVHNQTVQQCLLALDLSDLSLKRYFSLFFLFFWLLQTKTGPWPRSHTSS